MRELDVALGARSYPIRIGAGLLADSELLRSLVPGRHAMIVTDRNVAPHYLATVLHALDRKAVRALVIPAGEHEKNLARFGEVMQGLAELGAHRDATVLALGGGVVGDLAGFAAACWMRGVRLVQLPTSLLAMVDSSVGGKTAIDLPQGKNLVGAFHQPSAVVADTDCLATLPLREWRAGLAEVVKYAAIVDSGFFDWLERHAEALLADEPGVLAEAIAHCCHTKAGIVERDEQELGERLLLNFGHTFGHAIEAEQNLQGLNHGEAVAVGMVLAARLSARVGMAEDADSERLRALLVRFGLPVSLPAGLDPERLRYRMQLDKKNRDGQLRLILWRGIGFADVVTGIDPALVGEVLAQA